MTMKNYYRGKPAKDMQIRLDLKAAIAGESVEDPKEILTAYQKDSSTSSN
jgi:hypothetical protein